MECPKCKNAMSWNKGTSFYQTDGFWGCMCGKIVFKYQGTPDLGNPYARKAEEHHNVLSIVLRKPKKKRKPRQYVYNSRV